MCVVFMDPPIFDEVCLCVCVCDEQPWRLLVRRSGTSMCREIESIATVIVPIVSPPLGIGRPQELIG